MVLTGKVALITGGASGLGKHLAEALHSQGVTLVLADINEATGVETADEFNKLRTGSAFFYKTDVTKWDEQVHLFKTALEQVKRIDYVFANAGILESTYLPYTSYEKIEWTQPNLSTLDVNITGVLYTSHLAAQVFRTQPIVEGFRGKIVITASVAAFTAIAYATLYSTSKHALVGFIRSFAPQLAPDSITVNGVAPNITRSSLAPAALFDGVKDLGRLTPNEKVTEAFLSFLGESTETGSLKEVSMDDTLTRLAPEPLNSQVTENVKLLADTFKAAYSAPANAET